MNYDARNHELKILDCLLGYNGCAFEVKEIRAGIGGGVKERDHFVDVGVDGNKT